MKDEQKIAQAKRMEELIVYLKTTARELAKITGVHENTLYKICCAHNTISTHTARHTFIVTAISLGISPTIILSWTGHKNYEAMRPYIAIANETSTQAMARFNNL